MTTTIQSTTVIARTFAGDTVTCDTDKLEIHRSRRSDKEDRVVKLSDINSYRWRSISRGDGNGAFRPLGSLIVDLDDGLDGDFELLVFDRDQEETFYEIALMVMTTIGERLVA